MRIKFKTSLISLVLLVLVSMQTALATNPVEKRQEDFTTRFDIFFTVLEETFDASDYSETFSQSFFNFQTNYAANNCNYAERMKVLDKKEQILDDLIDNINAYTEKDVKDKMQAYLLYDFELTLLRNLDLLEAVPVNDESYKREPMYAFMIKEYEKDFDLGQIKSEVNALLDKYEANFNRKTINQDGSVTINGTYTECENRFNRTYKAWTETFEKFEKGNDQQVAALNKALKEFIKSLKEFKQNFNKNLNKVFKEEMAFLDKNTKKDDGFFKNMWNLTKGSAKAVGGDLIKVGKAFEKEYNKLTVNAGSSPARLKEFLISKRSVTSTQNAFQDALNAGLDLNQIAQSVEALKQDAENTLTFEKKVKKIQMLTDVHAAYSLEIQAKSNISTHYFQDCLNTIKGNSSNKSLDKIFEYVYTNQCK
mgnify:FL=1